MTAGGAVLLVAGILAFVAALFVLVMVLLRARLRGPEDAIYRSGSGSYPKLKGNGLIVLTGQRLLFRMAVGSDLDVPVAEITATREATTFQGSRLGNRAHLVVCTDAGEVGFFVDDNAAWIAAIAGAARIGAA